MGLRRVFKIRENLNLEIGADAMNLLNHTQLSGGAYAGGLGSTNFRTTPAKGLVPGMAHRDFRSPPDLDARDRPLPGPPCRDPAVRFLAAGSRTDAAARYFAQASPSGIRRHAK